MQRQRYLADIRLTSHLFDEGRFEDARHRLERYLPPSMAAGERDFGWHFLWEKYKRHVKVFPGHKGDVSTVAYVPGTQQLITGSHDRTVRIFDIATQKQLACLAGSSGQVNAIVVSPDEQTLLVGSDNGELSAWDLRPLQEQLPPHKTRSLAGHTKDVLCLAASPNGKYFVSAGEGGDILVWDMATFEILRRIPFHTDWVRDLEFLADGNRFVSISHDHRCGLWDARDGKQLEVFKTSEGMGLAVAVNPVDGLLASGDSRDLIRFLSSAAFAPSREPDGQPDRDGPDDAAAGNPPAREWQLADFDGWVRSLDFSADGEFLVAAGKDPFMRIYRRDDTGKYRIWRKVVGHGRCTWDVKFIADTRLILSAGEDGTARITSVLGSSQSERSLAELRSAEMATPLSSTQDGQQAVYLESDQGVRLVISNGILSETVMEPPAGTMLKRLVISPDGKWLATTRIRGGKEQFTLIDRRTLEEVATIDGDFPEKHSLAFHPRNEWIATSGVEGSLDIRGIPSLEVKIPYAISDSKEFLDINVPDILVSPDGRTLAACVNHGPNRLLVWDTETFGAPVVVPQIAHLLAVSSNGEHLALVGEDNRILLWHIASGKTVLTLEGHADQTVSGSFSHDDRYLATSAETGPIKIWALDAGELALDITEDLAVSEVTFVANDRLLVTHRFKDDDGKVHVAVELFP